MDYSATLELLNMYQKLHMAQSLLLQVFGNLHDFAEE
jgi:hypothetical protein